ncbi:MAG TPA: putative metal-binding protein [Cyclobacteriaceae bacterium]|nr:putative metal-binding protein [Cyclobacteriaceae bacterium]
MDIFEESEQVTDPEVTRKKFEQEVRKFRAVEQQYRTKGILIQNIQFPKIQFAFCSTKLQPNIIGYSVLLDFTNYDTEPPSIKFVNPFTNGKLKREEIPFAFLQFKSPFQHQDLIQGGGTMDIFFCIPGVREYHQHPAHSGDSWLLYRGKGEGTLLFILDQLYLHSLSTIRGFLLQPITKMQLHQEFIVPQINIQITQ